MTARSYTEQEVVGILMNLVNGIGLCAKGDIMPKRYKQSVDIDGKTHWVTGRTLKDLLEAYLELCIDQGVVMPPIVLKGQEKPNTPVLEGYLKEFNRIYKDGQQSLTKSSREYVINKFILPRWGKKHLDEITVNGVQEWLNKLAKDGYSHETLLKIKNCISPAIDAAVEDGYISQNPFKSKRLVIGGAETVHHKALPHEKMAEVREKLGDIHDDRLRMMTALLSYTGMRFEEVLGLKWEDLEPEEGWIYIQRAVVHPERNQPEVKLPKTKTSIRRIPLPRALWAHLHPRKASGFILGDDGPLTYTEARNLFRKLRKEFGLEEYSAHDFRDTCATEWREAGVPMDVIAHLLGHAKSDITENRYVKYRDELYQGVRAVMENPNGTQKGTEQRV